MLNYKPKNNPFCLRQACNVVAAAAFVAHLAHPGLIQAQPIAETYSAAIPTTLATDPGSRIAGPAPVDQPIAPDRTARAIITAYSSTPDQTDGSPFVSASGKRVYDGMIAANWLPFGTQVKIPSLFGNKIFTVEDRMNPRYGYGRLDIWLPGPRRDAILFGVKRVQVNVYYPSTVAKMSVRHQETEIALK